MIYWNIFFKASRFGSVPTKVQVSLSAIIYIPDIHLVPYNLSMVGIINLVGSALMLYLCEYTQDCSICLQERKVLILVSREILAQINMWLSSATMIWRECLSYGVVVHYWLVLYKAQNQKIVKNISNTGWLYLKWSERYRCGSINNGYIRGLVGEELT